MAAAASVVYSPAYDFRVPGSRLLHPFEGSKFSRAWSEACAARPRLAALTSEPSHPASDAELAIVHRHSYLLRTQDPGYVLSVLEVPLPRPLVAAAEPALRRILGTRIVRPMRWATTGTLMAARLALERGLAVNVGGGFHHASPDRGEGFCLFADVPVALEGLRRAGDLGRRDPVLVVDLDAHQGNGFERCLVDDPSAYVLDVYNADIYPADDEAAVRINRAGRLHSGARDDEYLEVVERELGAALADQSTRPLLAFYVAGTDIHRHDPLGRLDVSADGVIARDKLVIDSLRHAGIPTVVVTGGGYSPDSKHLVAAMLKHVADTYAPACRTERRTTDGRPW